MDRGLVVEGVWRDWNATNVSRRIGATPRLNYEPWTLQLANATRSHGDGKEACDLMGLANGNAQ